MNGDNCGNCFYWHQTSKACRRNPPSVVFLGIKQSLIDANRGEPQLVSVFPPMERHGWCGEHCPKDVDDDIIKSSVIPTPRGQ